VSSATDTHHQQPTVPVLSSSLDRVALRDPVFISDLHLCSARPRSVAGFAALLRSLEQTNLPDLVILGDLFEFWVGDDTLAVAASESAAADDAMSADIAQKLRRYVQQGGRVYLMHGNRDLLLGSAFCEASGAQRLADPCIASFEGASQGLGTVMLSHGDAYCTLDLPYQAFRSQARNPQFQAMFLTRPLPERRAMLGQARKDSESSKQQTAAQIMDVTPEAVTSAMRQAGVTYMIHGHTHRPARHDFSLDGSPAWRWVLPDWDLDADPPRGGGLHVLEGQLGPFEVRP
jgi:UDP-2,3-diacylglucosamine hydrolase